MRPIDSVTIQCPRCGERFDIQLEVDVSGRLVRDCEVCCAPFEMTVRRDGDRMLVSVSPGDG